MNNPDIKVSNTTIRSWINNGTLDVKSSHLRMSGRRIDSSYNYNTKEHKIATIGKEGHRYVDYLAYIEEHKNINVIELDSVIGKRNDNKTILTLMIKKFKLQLGFLLNHHNSTEVKNNLRKLFCKIIKFDKENNTSYFETYFKVFLTDNGSEFDFLVELEKEFDIKVFYTHANASYEKGTCERNHEFIRYILYKGWSFENYNQEEIELIFSHIASYPRKSLNKKTPYECALECTSKEFLDLLNVTLIEKDNVNLTPSLVRTVK